eukprot:1566946-Pleurochrysis_carterae.AAC.1
MHSPATSPRLACTLRAMEDRESLVAKVFDQASRAGRRPSSEAFFQLQMQQQACRRWGTPCSYSGGTRHSAPFSRRPTSPQRVLLLQTWGNELCA